MAKIEGYITNEMPIERMFDAGAESLSNTELLSVLIGTGIGNMNVVELSRFILNETGGIDKISGLDVHNLTQIKGIGKTKAARIASAFELAKRLDKITLGNKPIGNTPEAIYEYVKYNLRFKDRERFLVILLNNKHEIIGNEIVSIGTGTKTYAEPKEIFKKALQLSAYAICVCHNHPSGHSNPSDADIKLTERLVESGRILGVALVDHIIIGKNNYYSLKANGDM